MTLAVFFKTTCPSCQTTWPYLQALHRQYHVAGLALWGVSQDGRDVSKAFASERQSTFPVLVDGDLRISRSYDPAFVPTMLLIDPDGQITDTVVGFDKAGLNRLAAEIAQRLQLPQVVVAPADDGNPPFKPG
jgi:peroxiredoxin